MLTKEKAGLSIEVNLSVGKLITSENESFQLLAEFKGVRFESDSPNLLLGGIQVMTTVSSTF